MIISSEFIDPGALARLDQSEMEKRALNAKLKATNRLTHPRARRDLYKHIRLLDRQARLLGDIPLANLDRFQTEVDNLERHKDSVVAVISARETITRNLAEIALSQLPPIPEQPTANTSEEIEQPLLGAEAPPTETA